jgi:hypothetical protein
VKRLRGTLRPARTNDRAPRPRSVPVPKPPDDLSAQERRVWRRLAAEVPSGVYTAADFTSFLLLVRSVATAENPPENMSDSARIHWTARAQSLLNQFGMTPASREKVSVAGPAAVDPQRAREQAEAEFTGLHAVE